jgi:hypothetical protein
MFNALQVWAEEPMPKMELPREGQKTAAPVETVIPAHQDGNNLK